MAAINKTLSEELGDLGIIGSYILKPNRFYAKDGDRYISADVVSDGTANEIAAAVAEEGRVQRQAILTLALSEINALKALEGDYSDVKANLIQTYTRMYNYFTRQGMIALATIMATAIVNLNNM